MNVREVWGYQIRSTPGGKNIWPNALKLEAVKQLRDGARAGDIAAEIGAHECLVRKWHVADRRARGELVATQPSAFAEVRIQASAEYKTPAGKSADPCSARLQIGALVIEFPISIQEEDLHKIVRVAAGVA